ncbi:MULTISPECIES: TetR/AcrR family transcriptional regulator [unclassified Moorena]|uniref:TetR/AcrR family transcriptional regulator n=3 Tax=Moorena TaxID=1155738 RepID=UPI0013C9E4CA|nr:MULTISPECIES: TetR/AcrR family transcriptional regulator [unclassified Moorena]NEO22346.1 TetR/AcrR family transcriptional regulator [Moorena sp. SIO4A5]NEQ58427.1 TetR/AcrR family transcriptional regulator [Moorena sp. SIO4A1]
MKQKTAQQILDVAQSMVRNRGYSAFSYADISKEIGIRKASIHYHFPSKDDLVKELVKRYQKNLARKCFEIEQQETTPQAQLREFVNLYRDGLQDNKICLCGMLTADLSVLNSEIKAEIRSFFSVTESWVARLLHRGCETEDWQCSKSVEVEAKMLLSMLQGAQLLARVAEDSSAAFDQITGACLEEKLSAVSD